MLLNRKATFDETFNALMATTTEIKNEFQTGRYITIDSLTMGNNR